MGGCGKWKICAAAFLVALGLVMAAPASAESPESPIATTARKYIGTRGGQCWSFMQRVVSETTGRTVVGDYRQAYLNAGATEVSMENAGSGDIIQIALDGNSGPWASYPGLHTAIVLKNLGGGRFDAIDSNQNWDEMVSLRPGYDPYAAAARYGLQVHIYRIPLGPPPPREPRIAPSLTAGAAAVVDADGDCLNLRSSASPSGTKVTCLPARTAVTILSAPQNAGGMDWVQVQTPAGNGWVAAQFLAAPSGSGPAQPAITASPSGTTVPAETQPAPPPEQPSGSPEAAAAATSGDDALIRARVDDSPGCLRMREAPALAASIQRCLPQATPVLLLDEPRVTADGHEWARIKADSGDGWVAAQYLIRE